MKNSRRQRRTGETKSAHLKRVIFMDQATDRKKRQHETMSSKGSNGDQRSILDCLLTVREVEHIRQLITKTGENGAMATLGLTRGTLPRVVARLPARRATVEMVRGRLRDLEEFRKIDV